MRRLLEGFASPLSNPPYHGLDPFRHGHAWQHRVHRDAGTMSEFGEPARQSKHSGFGDAVMQRVYRHIDARFRTEENHASPAAVHHGWHIGARKTDAGHDVDMEQSLPVLIGGIEEGLGLENSKIVDQDITPGFGPDQVLTAAGTAEICRHGADG